LLAIENSFVDQVAELLGKPTNEPADALTDTQVRLFPVLSHRIHSLRQLFQLREETAFAGY
jgi:hypothetical protein